MHKSRLACFVIDCQVDDIEPGVNFWAAALAYPAGDADDKYVVLEATPTGPKMLLQKVEHPSRIHLDIETDNKEAEVQRLEKLGAKVVKLMEHWVVMEAPTGHRFCVVNPQRPDFHTASDVNVWE
ncbi:VOC family protein [Undibacterium umbellatum]|uniref:VOC family protein n=1 Tax=Undibacterium umbellatum TaxID=2762300 RepID=A0ABR6ZEU2_9BURK|nr:VOC family protein [Undibacterium umbellatum]MBC3910213.1 VOC family protein [Undibacterium umbellatum]